MRLTHRIDLTELIGQTALIGFMELVKPNNESNEYTEDKDSTKKT